MHVQACNGDIVPSLVRDRVRIKLPILNCNVDIILLPINKRRVHYCTTRRQQCAKLPTMSPDVTVHIWGKRHRAGGCGRINGMTRDEEVAALRAENALLRTELATAQALIAQLQARIGELEQRKTPVPGFVKANTERKERAEPRRKR